MKSGLIEVPLGGEQVRFPVPVRPPTYPPTFCDLATAVERTRAKDAWNAAIRLKALVELWVRFLTCGTLRWRLVEAYHQLFFDVRNRLHASDWVLHLAVRSNPINDFAGPQPAGVWKYMGFMGGPLALDAVVAVTSDQPLPSWLRETFTTDPVFEEQRFRLKTKLSVAALTAKSASQLGSILDLSEQLHDLEVAAGLEAGEEECLVPVVGEFLAAIGRLAASPPKAPPCRRGSAKRPRKQPQPTDSGGNRRE